MSLSDLQYWYPALVSAGVPVIPAVVVENSTATLRAASQLLFPVCQRKYFEALKTLGQDDDEPNYMQIWHGAIASNVEARSAGSELAAAIEGARHPFPSFFVRLSTRSPKDCFLKPWGIRSPLCLADGNQGSAVLCSSQRVVDDLNQMAERPQLVIRPFVELHKWSEMRVFVSNGMVTAVSQYSWHTPLSVEQRRTLESRIPVVVDVALKCATALAESRLHPVCFVVDLALTVGTETDGDELVVIEVNPFGKCTDACLFSWTADHDVLQNGPFAARFTSSGSPL